MKKTAISRRQWLGKISVPALTAGVAMIGSDSQASPNDNGKEDNQSGTRVYNICDHGAKGDGKILNTKAIQAAIDQCFADKGGTVLIPAGDFLCGTIELKSNVTLHISAAGRLLGSPRRE